MPSNRLRFGIIHAIAGTAVLLLSIVLMGTVGMAAENTGSISIMYSGQNQEGGKILLSGAEFVLYQVGTMQDGEWVLSEEFGDSGVSLRDDTASGRREQAEKLWDYSVEMNIQGTVKKTDASGKAMFNNLSEGLYLLGQTRELVYGEQEVFGSTPFLISIPTDIDGKTTHQVTIEPKSERKTSELPEEPSMPRRNVKTGDTVSFGVYVMLLFISVGLFFVLRKVRKE